jgi:hypothetical protein
LNPLTHGIVTPLPMVYWTSYSWYIETPTNDILTLYQWYLEPPSMVFWPPYQWYIEPPTHGMLTLYRNGISEYVGPVSYGILTLIVYWPWGQFSSMVYWLRFQISSMVYWLTLLKTDPLPLYGKLTPMVFRTPSFLIKR